MKKKSKYGLSWDILDAMWDKFLTFRSKEDKEILENLTWSDFVNSCSPADAKDYVKDAALRHFQFEVKYLYGKPNRDTIRHLYGEHAFLYDVYGCEIHRFECVTHDDERYNDSLTLFCPTCNKGIMFTKDQDEYMSLIEGRYLTPENWEAVKRIAKFYKDYQRTSNFKYELKQWTQKGYIQYRIKDLFGKLFSKKK